MDAGEQGSLLAEARRVVLGGEGLAKGEASSSIPGTDAGTWSTPECFFLHLELCKVHELCLLDTGDESFRLSWKSI